METIKIAGLETRVLEPEEAEKAVEFIRDDIKNRKSDMDRVTISTTVGDFPGSEFFYMAQSFESQSNQLPSERIVENASIYLEGIGELIKTDPDFHEYPFLMAKNSLVALNKQEMDIMNNLEEIDPAMLESKKEKISNIYSEIRCFLGDSMRLFDEFRKNTNEENLEFYFTTMGGYLASSYRREAMFNLKTDVTKEDMKEIKKNLIQTKLSKSGFKETYTQMFKKLGNMWELAKKSMDLYKRLLENGVYLRKQEVAVALVNMANSMKFFRADPIIKKALVYYDEAEKILGENQTIEQGREFFQSEEKGIYDFFNLMNN